MDWFLYDNGLRREIVHTDNDNNYNNYRDNNVAFNELLRHKVK